jgi:hypothetical protein
MTVERCTLRGSAPEQWIEFVPTPSISRLSFDVTASFAGYRVTATSVTIFAGSFLHELASFERHRAGTAKLTGTYDFALQVEPFESRGDALVSFSISDLLPLPIGRAGGCRLDGAFVVEGEHVAKLLRDMERLFAFDVA